MVKVKVVDGVVVRGVPEFRDNVRRNISFRNFRRFTFSSGTFLFRNFRQVPCMAPLDFLPAARQLVKVQKRQLVKPKNRFY